MKSQSFQGAEALILLRGRIAIKNRMPKLYRLPVLDKKLRKIRTRKELKLLEKASKIISVPFVNKSSDYEIDMELVKGKKLSESLDGMKNALKICMKIGENIAKLHDKGIIHGDLTTSNMIYSEKEDKLYFIDFGLGYESIKPEDKAVDLHLIKRALEAKHFKHFQRYFDSVIKGYKISNNSKEVLKRLEKVEKRGRYKEQY